MKKYVFSLLLNFIFYNSIFFANAEPCGNDLHLNCPQGTKYPYRVCIENLSTHEYSLGEYCTDDPTGVLPPGYKISTTPIPFCLDPQLSTFPDRIDLPSQPPGNTVFTKEKAIKDIDKAVESWNCICGVHAGIPGCPCTVKILFVTDPKDKDFNNDIKNHPIEKTLAMENTSVYRKSCILNCNGSYIKINFIDKFYIDKSGRPIRFFINEELTNSSVVNEVKDNGCEVFSFYDVVLHEVGHLFGFGHYDPEIPYAPCNPPGDGIMNSTLDANQNSSKGLSNDDMCMFRKLYCKTLSIDEFVVEQNNQINPNPAHNDIVQIKINIDSQNGAYVRINLYTMLGTHIRNITGNQFFDYGSHNIDCNVHDLLNGYYFVVIEYGNKRSIIPFIVIK